MFADWLEEHGDADRAEFIRVQIERARLSPYDERQSELQARERRLLVRHFDEWRDGIPAFRTFPTAETAWRARRAPRADPSAPLLQLASLGGGAGPSPFPLSQTLTHLDISWMRDAGPGTVEILVNSLLWERLEELNLEALFIDSERTAERIVSRLKQSRIKRLSLRSLFSRPERSQVVLHALARADSWGR